MSAAKKIEMTPDEQFIQEALRCGRATKQDVSLRAIGTPDVSLQARVEHLDLDHCSRLERAAMTQGDLAPIVLFRDARHGVKSPKYHLADGHHRHHVYTNMLVPRRSSIPAWVIDSDDPHREALEFATMCNREMCLGRTDADITRAIEMLLMDEKWWKSSDGMISRHVGASMGKVTAIRSRLSRESHRPLPVKVLSSDGHEVAYRRKSSPVSGGRNISSWLDGKSQASLNGLRIKSNNYDTVKTKIEDAQADLRAKRWSLSYDALFTRFLRHGFLGINSPQTRYLGLRGFCVPGIICLPCDFSTKDSLPLACGQLILARQKVNEPTARMVILCYVDDPGAAPAMLDLARAAGFEFMTPDELIASLNGNLDKS